jgi:hypothetical protein
MNIQGLLALSARIMTEDRTSLRVKWIHPDNSETFLPDIQVPAWVNGEEVSQWILGYETSLRSIPVDYQQGTIEYDALFVRESGYTVNFKYTDVDGNVLSVVGANNFPEPVADTDENEEAIATQFASSVEAMAQVIIANIPPTP